MSGHAEDPVSEESKRFFTFFNLSMILVAITGIEIVIIYVQTFEGSSIIGVLFTTSILKFVGVVWWFMHLRWDKFLNTVLFLMGLVIALGTYFAVIYMADTHPEIENFSVNVIEKKWEAGKSYAKGDYMLEDGEYYQSNFDHVAPASFSETVNTEEGEKTAWKKVDGVPHQVSWKVTSGDLIEINSMKPELAFFHKYHPLEDENIEGSKIELLTQAATKDDFRIKVRSESYLTVWPVPVNEHQE
jgi:cytochrome c oxidase subunit IV